MVIIFYTISKVLISLALFNYENNSQDISVVWKIILLKKADEEQRRLPIVVCLGIKLTFTKLLPSYTTITGSHSIIMYYLRNLSPKQNLLNNLKD